VYRMNGLTKGPYWRDSRGKKSHPRRSPVLVRTRGRLHCHPQRCQRCKWASRLRLPVVHIMHRHITRHDTSEGDTYGSRGRTRCAGLALSASVGELIRRAGMTRHIAGSARGPSIAGLALSITKGLTSGTPSRTLARILHSVPDSEHTTR
jgi:hypothetical protein